MISPGGRDHGEPHSYPRPSPYVPYTVRVTPYVGRIVDRFIVACDGESIIDCGKLQAGAGVPKTDPVVQPSRPVFAQHQILDSVIFTEVFDRDRQEMAIGGTSPEALLAGIAIAKPRSRHEVGGELLVSPEVSVQRQQDKRVLLRITPTTLGAV